MFEMLVSIKAAWEENPCCIKTAVALQKGRSSFIDGCICEL